MSFQFGLFKKWFNLCKIIPSNSLKIMPLLYQKCPFSWLSLYNSIDLTDDTFLCRLGFVLCCVCISYCQKSFMSLALRRICSQCQYPFSSLFFEWLLCALGIWGLKHLQKFCLRNITRVCMCLAFMGGVRAKVKGAPCFAVPFSYFEDLLFPCDLCYWDVPFSIPHTVTDPEK